MLILSQTDLASFSTKKFSSRRRFQDFVFLRHHLKLEFPACVVPPLPGKHRLGPVPLPPSVLLPTLTAFCRVHYWG